MTAILEMLQFEFMQRALIVCALVGFTNGFLGSYIVLRRLALMADALSHSLLPGLAAAAIFFGLSASGLLLGGLIAGLFVILGGQLISRSSRIKDDTAIASLYIIAFAAGVLLIKYSRVPIDLGHFLFGNVLGVGNSDLWLAYGIAWVALPVVVILQRPLLISLFEPDVARSQGVRVDTLHFVLLGLVVLAMIASLQAVGVLLSLGLLILPAATVYLLTDKFVFLAWGSGILGMSAGILGLLVSYWINVPTGPAIVLLLGLALLLAYLLSPRYGLVRKFFHGRHLHEESMERWDTKS